MAPDITITVASTDQGVLARYQSHRVIGKCADFADPVYKDFGQSIRHQVYPDRDSCNLQLDLELEQLRLQTGPRVGQQARLLEESQGRLVNVVLSEPLGLHHVTREFPIAANHFLPVCFTSPGKNQVRIELQGGLIIVERQRPLLDGRVLFRLRPQM